MSDERGKRHKTSDDRALESRTSRRLGRLNAPKHVDPERTPPPTVDYERLPAEMAECLKPLERAVVRLWEGRDDGKRIDRLETKIDSHIQTVERHAALIDEALLPTFREIPGKFDDMNDAIAKVGNAIGLLAAEVRASNEALQDRVSKMDSRLFEIEETTDVHAKLLAVLENERLPPRVAAIELQLHTKAAGDIRELTLTKRRNRIVAGVVSAVSAIGGAVAGWLTK